MDTSGNTKMSIEQKAKAYDIALEGARKELGVDRKEWEVVQRVLHNIFPELAESEDEIHRKWILEYLYDGLQKASEQFKGQFKSAIDWLEKQKEHTPAEPELKIPDWVHGNWDDEYMINTVIGRYSLHAEVAKKRGDTHDYNLSKSMENWLRNVVKPLILEKQKEQKPAEWKPSEEQMSMLLAVIRDPNNAGSESCFLAFKSLYEDLKKLM